MSLDRGTTGQREVSDQYLGGQVLGPQLPRGGRSILGSSSCPDEDPLMELQRDVVIVPPKGQTLVV